MWRRFAVGPVERADSAARYGWVWPAEAEAAQASRASRQDAHCFRHRATRLAARGVGQGTATTAPARGQDRQGRACRPRKPPKPRTMAALCLMARWREYRDMSSSEAGPPVTGLPGCTGTQHLRVGFICLAPEMKMQCSRTHLNQLFIDFSKAYATKNCSLCPTSSMHGSEYPPLPYRLPKVSRACTRPPTECGLG